MSVFLNPIYEMYMKDIFENANMNLFLFFF